MEYFRVTLEHVHFLPVKPGKLRPDFRTQSSDLHLQRLSVVALCLPFY